MTTKIQARISDSLKAEGELILKKLGITTTELMRMTFRQLVMKKGIPFDVNIPNPETIESFDEAKDPQKITRYADAKEAIADMWKD
ncbi:MAG: type II toxin-antitoxin system RelB/DinJ family antitoxin [Deltaproteobacteria bacterium]|nr:type II toxin-antitoxin system RelB/DinJ family antitoxin [Candidatus Tharpella aukensis]